MSRSIRFRAWFKGINVMGNVVTLNGSNRNGYEGNMWDSVTAECYINERQQFYTAYNFELMAFTGLYDKTGKEIFEGDLIRVDMCECVGHDDEGNEIWEDCEGSVSFEDGMFVFDGHSAGTIPLNAYIENVTVIGNIYEHKHPSHETIKQPLGQHRNIMIKNITVYCSSDCCTQNGNCDHCENPILVDRTYADAIKVTLPDGYTQRFWVDLTDLEAIERVYLMKQKGIL